MKTTKISSKDFLKERDFGPQTSFGEAMPTGADGNNGWMDFCMHLKLPQLEENIIYENIILG
ncbi:MAG: hypothetical protein Q8847_02485 [Sweet potato little leaf phytoplasma]|nr:hypothetical protein [Sweet potato little leaf phytoplasma]